MLCVTIGRKFLYITILNFLYKKRKKMKTHMQTHKSFRMQYIIAIEICEFQLTQLVKSLMVV